MSEPLQFISQSVIQRLKDGSFVPERRSKAGAINLVDPQTPEQGQSQERRNTISPLAVTKRCVRYDHHVFLNRKPLIIEMAESLNSVDKKLILMGGVQGCGKTSLARGIIELMGGGKEQLLWFDVNAHTDFDEIIVFLMQYITYICSALSIQYAEGFSDAEADKLPDDPFQKLEALILKVAHIPLLIVIDNVEHIVDAKYQIRSFPLKETLNFLLSFPNIKITLCGERLPYADMSAKASVVTDIKLAGLNEKDVIKLLQSQSLPNPLKQVNDSEPENTLEQEALIELYQKTQGYPWLLKTIFYLKKHHTGEFSSLTELNHMLATRKNDNPSDAIARFIYNHLTPEEQEVAQVLALVRHPADFNTLLAMSRYCKPGLAMGSPENFQETFKSTLEHSILKPLMKRTFPPQSMLAHIKNRHEAPSQFQPGYELYRHIKKAFATVMSSAERARIHRLLQDFYLKEKNKAFADRIYQVKSKPLIAEAKYHGNSSRERRSIFNDTSQRLDSKAYLYGGIKPLDSRPESGPGLAQSSSLSSESLEPLDLGVEPVSLDELDLSEEEKNLLSKDGQAERFNEDLEREKLEELEDPEKLEEPETLLDTSLTFSEHLTQAAEEPIIQPLIDPVEAIETENSVSSLLRESELEAETGSESGELDLIEKQILQHLAGAVANHNRPKILTHLLRLARHRRSKGFFQKAEECLGKALEFHKEASEVELADIYGQLGSIHKETYRHNSALDYLKKAITHYEHHAKQASISESAYEQGQLYEDLGDIYAFRGQHHQAISAYYKGLELLSLMAETGSSQADLYFKLAQVYDVMNVPENAINYYEQSLSLDRANHNELSCAATLSNMAALHQEAGRFEKALDCFNQSLGYDRRNDYSEGVYKTLEKMAYLYIQLKLWQKAEQSYQQAMATALNEDNSTWKANIYLKLGNLYEHLNNWKKAWDHFRLAQDVAILADLSEESQALLNRKIKETALAIHSHDPHSTG